MHILCFGKAEDGSPFGVDPSRLVSQILLLPDEVMASKQVWMAMEQGLDPRAGSRAAERLPSVRAKPRTENSPGLRGNAVRFASIRAQALPSGRTKGMHRLR